jgi:SAM-dependent methyltransferase
MNPTQRLRRYLVSQFHHPTGLVGRVAGWVMGHRASNVARNRWAVELLDVQPHERVLDLGCGPGVALAAFAERVTDGLVVGVDHSQVVLDQAARRNADAIAAGRLRLVNARAEAVLASPDGDSPGTDRAGPPFDEPFDAALAVNSLGMWDDPDARLVALRTVLRTGGRVALVSQPRSKGADAGTTRAAGSELADRLERAGFTDVHASTLDLDPPVVCVHATNPG